MFGTNAIVGKKFFKDAPPRSLYVTSVFYTLQGEGPLSGQPAVFVRLAKCNLACGFCDTFFDSGDWLTYEQLNAKIYTAVCSYWNDRGLPVPSWALPKCDGDTSLGPYAGINLIVTGGEPTLQDNLGPWLCSQLGNFKNIQIESNGTQGFDFIPADTDDHKVIVVCSPKCAEKDGKPSYYLTPRDTNLVDAFKFVMCTSDPGLGYRNPYSEVPPWALSLAQESGVPVYVSPMNVYKRLPAKAQAIRLPGQEPDFNQRSTVDEVVSFWEDGLLDMEANRRNHEYAARYCMEHGLIFQMQTHLFASLA
jgi:organic radical activating enzyme